MVVGLLLISGCKQDQELLQRPPDPNDLADIDGPVAVAFPSLEPGDSTTQTVTISNVGNATLEVSSMRVESSTAFSVSLPQVIYLAPEETHDFEVAFTPVNVDDAGFMVVGSNDPDEAELYIELLGGLLAPVLQITPDPVQYDSVAICGAETETLTLANIGGATLTLDGVTTTGTSFQMLTQLELPLDLGPDETTEVAVRFTPLSEDEHEGELWVTSNEAVGSRSAFLAGTGGGDAVSEAEETFRQPDGPWDKTDVLFYVDRSLSMENNLKNLESNFGVFLSTLSATDADYQIMVATRDDGCHNESIITPDTPDANTVFSTATRGNFGEYTEAGLWISSNAFEETGAGGCNEGFVRKDAKTIAVMVSDEPDQSPAATGELVSRMQAVAPSLGIVAIAGDVPLGCGLTADAGYGYVDAVMLTGGDFLSICDADWGEHLEVIAELATAAPTDTFPLSYVPDLKTIEVLVNGVASPSWAYEALENAVVFDEGAWPDPGAWIEVNYALPSECVQGE